jgi:hypothetical protein
MSDDTDLTPEQEAELEQLALEATKLAAEAEAIAERVATIKAIMRGRLPRGTHQLGAHVVLVKAGARRLNATRLTTAFPFTDRPDLYKAALDTAAVKDRIAPADLAAYYDEGTPTVEIR